MLASEISRSLQIDDIIHAYGSECLVAFTKTLHNSPNCTIEAFLSSRSMRDRSELAALVAIDLRHRLSTQRSCRIEDYLTRFPELAVDSEQLLDLIYAEYCERRQHEQSAQPQEYFQRFPDFQKSLERLFQLDSLLQVNLAEDEVASMPEAGSRFLEFRLAQELGRGGCGRVFLAEQETLSNRRVVLKITSRHNIEDRTLARLNHPNIVPILSVHHDDESGLHAVCMPYQHAVALSDVKRAWRETPFPMRADEYLKAVAASIRSELPSEGVELTPTGFPLGKSFVLACAWIMFKMADALHHAHMRHICHRDVKPSNILLTAAGNPLLVDFNLSFNEKESGTDFRAFFGGTLSYIPPEQILALHPIEQGRAEDVGPRADIYSLAATIFEILTGQPPFELPEPGIDLLTALQSQLAKRHAGIPSARSWNPSVPKDLDALLSKCLDPAPEKRYDSAAQLADDLSLFLRDYPLGHLPHIPLSVRMHKFTRRNRRALAGTALLAITVSFSAVYLRHERVARGRAESQINQLQVTAEKEADAAMAVLPNDSYKYFLLGRDYFIARQFTHARRCFSRVIELTPDYAHAYLYRGRCFANLDKDSEALSDYTLSIKHDPENVYPFLMRAICYATSDRFGSTDKAVADLKEVEKLMPADEEESTKVIYMEVARTYSAISARSSSTEQKTVFLRLAEENLLIAIDLGLAMDYLNEVRRNDRFQMLEPLLKQQRVKKLLIDRGLTLR